jgi:hypothetical protein
MEGLIKSGVDVAIIMASRSSGFRLAISNAFNDALSTRAIKDSSALRCLLSLIPKRFSTQEAVSGRKLSLEIRFSETADP